MGLMEEIALDFTAARARMVAAQLKRRGIQDQAVLDAMAAVPRENFVDPELAEFAYEDTALPIEEGQTISQPFIVGLMLEAARLTPGAKFLEIGAGSGYAAAVASRIVTQVFAIERHARLAEAAGRRFRKLGYRNIKLKTGDGSQGWPAAAPFDVILVAAAGPSAPESLKAQLAIGGRLIIPTGEEGEQVLRRITRVSDTRFQEDTLGAVKFVPLIGAEGFETRENPGAIVRRAAEPLPFLDDADFAAAFDRFGDRRVVLLGEASHGTSEFYRARAAITRRLIERHGFSIVAVEADWPDAAAVNRHVTLATGKPHKTPFQRFPTWMWRNEEFEAFVEWLRGHNAALPPDRRASFYGLDIYNMQGSIAAVLAYLDKTDPKAAAIARERYGCLTPWQRDPAVYGHAVLTAGYEGCADAVVAQCRDLLNRQMDYARHDGAQFFDAAQNARLIAAAERYYRVMYYGGAESWNLRDTHMFETLHHILEQRGPHSKAVVWAHNSHIGDARQTGMGQDRDEINIGQLARQAFGEEAALIGLGTHEGTVAAASDWDGPMEIKQVKPSLPESWERVMHNHGPASFLLDMKNAAALMDEKPERFIGVIYRPQTERLSHYVPAAIARQFDAFVWFDQTHAVTPLEAGRRQGVPDTYPFGL